MLKHTLIALALTTTAASAAPVDWTPYLKGMQHNCDTENIDNLIINNKIPKNLKSNVIKKTGKVGEAGGKITLYLKNATAFGQSISKITYESGESGESGGLTLNFANKNFMNLMPKFSFGYGEEVWKVDGKKKAWISMTSWQFDRGLSDVSDNGRLISSKNTEFPYQEYEEYLTLNNDVSEFWWEQANKLNIGIRHIKEMEEGRDDRHTLFHGIITDETGYSIEPIADADNWISLNFDKSHQTISCSRAFLT